MEEEQDDSGAPIIIYPTPPPFYKSFTPENLARLEQFKKDADTSNSEHEAGASSPQLSASQLLSLPTELRYLVPPEPPADDEEYRVFNQPTRARNAARWEQSVDRMGPFLEQAGILTGWSYERLAPAPPVDHDPETQTRWNRERQQYLLRYVRSLLLNFVELLGLLADDPRSEHKDEKLKDMLTLVVNMHALINEYRPHQARETMILAMQEQLDRKRAEVEAIRQMKDKVAATLAGFGKRAPARTVDAPKAAAAASAEDKRKETQRHMWHAMDELPGH